MGVCVFLPPHCIGAKEPGCWGTWSLQLAPGGDLLKESCGVMVVNS